MAKQDSTTKRPETTEWLGDLCSRTLWPLDGLIKTLEEHEDDALSHLMAVLIPLVDQVRSDLDIVAEVLGQSFGGQIQVVITDHLRTFGAFDRKCFKKAFVLPADAQA